MNESLERVGVSQILIGADHAGRRIDNYLGWVLEGLPKTRIYRLLRKGEVRVNGKRVAHDYRLQTGDSLRIPPYRPDLPVLGSGAAPSIKELAFVNENVLFEDENLLVLDKPAGIAVHGGTGNPFGVIERLRIARPADPYLELVHRLDRGTSGCLLIAKRPDVLRELHELMRLGEVVKRYRLLVAGRWHGRERTVSTGLQKDSLRGGEHGMTVSINGKPASTRFECVEIFGAATLLQAQIFTGRTHQIRVHAAHIGHPVAGDSKYGDDHFNGEMRRLGLKGMCLHAASIVFRLPSCGRVYRLNADIPDDLRKFLRVLRADARRVSA
jgi:23S rRNA pseudouridine955/2504/2580 synthase